MKEKQKHRPLQTGNVQLTTKQTFVENCGKLKKSCGILEFYDLLSRSPGVKLAAPLNLLKSSVGFRAAVVVPQELPGVKRFAPISLPKSGFGFDSSLDVLVEPPGIKLAAEKRNLGASRGGGISISPPPAL